MEQQRKPRYPALDLLRGITLISMMAYHACWNLGHIFGVIRFPYAGGIYLWQQSICWTFILLSGFCWSLSRRHLKRGLITLGGAVIIALATHIAMPDAAISFGVLSLMASSMLLMIPLHRICCKAPSLVGLFSSFLAFLITKSTGEGYWNLFGLKLLELPEHLYANYLTAYLGFPSPSFASADYFPLIPWFFLYLTGYFLYRYCSERGFLQKLPALKFAPLNFLGKNSLLVYLVHQPFIYGVMLLIFQ